MTALTPQQMREMADRHWLPIPHEEEVAAALRAAADQLEAVRTVVVDNSFQAFDGEEVVYSDLVMAIVYPADTAPQEGRDD